MAQTGQQPQDHAEQPRAHGVQRSHAGTDTSVEQLELANIAVLLFKDPVFEISVIVCILHAEIRPFFPPVQILVARPEDSGMYVCTARNNEGTTETRVEVMVEGGSQVPTVPRASVPEPLVVMEEGQTATLRCEAHGNDG